MTGNSREKGFKVIYHQHRLGKIHIWSAFVFSTQQCLLPARRQINKLLFSRVKKKEPICKKWGLVPHISKQKKTSEKEAKIWSYTWLQQPAAKYIKKNHKLHLLYVGSLLENNIWISKGKALVEVCLCIWHELCSAQLTVAGQDTNPPINASQNCY